MEKGIVTASLSRPSARPAAAKYGTITRRARTQTKEGRREGGREVGKDESERGEDEMRHKR